MHRAWSGGHRGGSGVGVGVFGVREGVGRGEGLGWTGEEC